MRIAAGILMIIYGVKTIGFLVGSLSKWDFLLTCPLYLVPIVIISAVFIINGGVFCLKRKYWKLCLASSLYLLLYMISDLYPIVPVPFKFQFPTWLYMTLILSWGILPQIFVCLRKSEWQEISA